MRPERISIFNYEAFYLDHLEGTLGDEDTALLLAFLEENPSLKMFDESLPLFDTDEIHLTDSEKLSLKKIDDNEKITLLNVEYFMIASAEDILSEEKNMELTSFIALNPELEKEQAYFRATKLSPDATISFEEKEELKSNLDHTIEDEITLVNAEYFMIASTEGILSKEKREEFASLISSHPELKKDSAYFGATVITSDMSIIYDDKEGLKRKAVILWPYMAIAAAASVIIAFFILTNKELEEIPSMADKNNETEQVDEDETDLAPNQNDSQFASDERTDVVIPGIEKTPENRNVTQFVKEQKVERIDDRYPMVALERRKARPLVHTFEDYKIQPISRDLPTNSVQTNTYSDVAYTGYGHMTNPIQGVTSRINKRIKPDVDFRTAKASKDQAGGFYLKIGKFELLRKKHKPKN